MEFLPVKKGGFPELYHLGFDGIRFQLFLSDECWSRFVELTQKGTLYATKSGPSYVPPSKEGGSFGYTGCAEAQRAIDGTMCIEIPAISVLLDERGCTREMAIKVETLAHILVVFSILACEVDARHEEFSEDILSQLFFVNTYRGSGVANGNWGLEVTVSPRARAVLRDVDSAVFARVTIAMHKHFVDYHAFDPRGEPGLGDFTCDVHAGVIQLKTFGFCSCLGCEPPRCEDDGYYLSSHNVDNAAQQFNLLVGLAYLWQAVREKVKETLPAM